VKKLIFILSCITILSASNYGQITYHWTGATNSDFSVANNWTPLRQFGRVDDILIVNNGITNNIVNVYQVTIGQLKILDNTVVYLTPASGNAKVLNIQGVSANSDPDLYVASGSRLTFTMTDPVLNILIKTGATMRVDGEFKIYSPSLAPYLKAIDYQSVLIYGVFEQDAPGHLFLSDGVAEVVRFMDNSTMKVRGSALNPFGANANVTAFDENSNFVFVGSIANSNNFFTAGLVGRYGNISWTQSCTMILSGIQINMQGNVFMVDGSSTLTTSSCTGEIWPTCFNWIGGVYFNKGVYFHANCLKKGEYSFEVPKTLVSITVFNILGQEIAQGVDLNSLDLPSGVYFIRTLYSDLSISSQKLMLIHK